MHKLQPFGCVKVQLPSMRFSFSKIEFIRELFWFGDLSLCVSLPFRSACIDPLLLVVITVMFIMTITKYLGNRPI